MLLLAMGAMLSYGQHLNVTVWVLVLPLLVLAINLTAAIASNRKINRQPGLLIFHLGLLGIVILVAIGRLTHFDAQLEIPVGATFNSQYLGEVRKGPFHISTLDELGFVQGPYTVEYAPEIRRGATYSYVKIKDKDGKPIDQVVGDDVPMVVRGYRFYTSFNKGFAAMLTWIPNDGLPQAGYINMPSYPLNDFRQKNEWTPPGANINIQFWLKLETTMNKDDYWVLSRDTSSGVLVATAGEQRTELHEGDELHLEEGVLRYDRLNMWMGYTIFYDPTLRWLFVVSIVAIAGLGWHLWKKAALL
jgi:cytochrome c biogenesis protein